MGGMEEKEGREKTQKRKGNGKGVQRRRGREGYIWRGKTAENANLTSLLVGPLSHPFAFRDQFCVRVFLTKIHRDLYVLMLLWGEIPQKTRF